jgi:Tfp pilus assembly protein PilN
MAARKTTIELLPQEEWEKRSFGKILKWILTVGRHIVIITELVVILAFLARFKLDRDLTDLNEEIKQKQAIITSASTFEKNYRFLQKRLSTIGGLRKNQLETDKILAEIASLLPFDVTLSDFTVTGQQMALSATALSDSGLATFISNLKSSNRFTNLTISQLTSEETQEIKFELASEVASVSEAFSQSESK